LVKKEKGGGKGKSPAKSAANFFMFDQGKGGRGGPVASEGQVKFEGDRSLQLLSQKEGRGGGGGGKKKERAG